MTSSNNIQPWRSAPLTHAATKRFVDMAHTRAWAADFGRWYNNVHFHSGIRYVSPADCHAGRDLEVLVARHAVYTAARERNPSRWSGATRDGTPIGAVMLNPERETAVAAHLLTLGETALAA